MIESAFPLTSQQELTNNLVIELVQKYPELRPVIYDQAIFLRGHHLRNWNEMNTDDLHGPGRFDVVMAKNALVVRHAINFSRKRAELLAGNLAPQWAGIEVDFLNIIQKKGSSSLQPEDAERLKSFQTNPNTFLPLAILEADSCQAVWNLPDTAQVVISRRLDWQCALKTSEGFFHCQLPLPEQNADSEILKKLVLLKRSGMISESDAEKIQVIFDKRKPETVDAVIVPLPFIKKKSFVLKALTLRE